MLYVILIIIIVLLVVEKIIDKKNILPISKETLNLNEKYIKKDYLLTQTELKFYKILKQITEELNLVICPQVSLYEIVRNKDFKDFNRISSKSIDFVIAEPNLKIRFCVELDDYTHNQNKRIIRDKFIDNLFKDLNIKILRIPVQNFYNMEELKNKIKSIL